MSRRGQSRTITIVSTAALLAAASYTYAQDTGEPAFRLTVDVGTGLRVGNNVGLEDPAEGTTTTSRTTLNFGLVSETRTSRLTAGVSTGLDFRDEPGTGSEFDFVTPNSFITYSQNAANSAVQATLRYRDELLDERILTFLDEDLQPVDFVVDVGRLQRLSGSARLSLGIEAPLGFDATLSFDDREYTDTFDPDLYDRRTVSLATVTRLRFSDVMTGRLLASVRQFDAEDVPTTERTSTSLGFGLSYEISPRTRVNADVTYDRIETTEFGAFTETTDGIGFSVAAVTDLPNGSITGSIRQTVNTSGDRTTINLGRAMELPLGALSYGVGYTFSDEGEDRLTADFAISRDLPTGSVQATLTQQAGVNDDEEQVLVTRVGVAYNQEVNSVSGFTVNFGLGRTEEIGLAGSDETTRANLGLTYRRELTEDWDWTLGYQTQYLKENAGSARNSNTVFTRIDRRFTLRP